MGKTMAEHLRDNGCIDEVMWLCPRGFANETTTMPVPQAFEAEARKMVDNLVNDVNADAAMIASADLGASDRSRVLDWLSGEYSGLNNHGVPTPLWDEWCMMTWDGSPMPDAKPVGKGGRLANIRQ